MQLSEIKSNPNNPRFIKDDKFQKLVQSLKDFPEMADVREIVINKENIVLGGNMRLKAMIEAGWTEAPVKIVDWSEEKQREFIIKDNVSGGEWDWDSLANEWDAEPLDAWGLDLPDALSEDVEVEEDEAPEVSNDPPQSELGKIYQLGRHRVMCGDSTHAGSVALLMNGDKADMVFTDPPYNLLEHKIETGVSVEDWLPSVLYALEDDSFFVSTCQQPFLSEWMVAYSAAGLNYKNEIIWHKKESSSGFADVKRVHENMVIYAKGSPKYKDTKVSFDEWLDHIDYNKLETLKRHLSTWKAKAEGREVRDAAFYKNNRVSDRSKRTDAYYDSMSIKASNSLGATEFSISTVWDIMRDTSNAKKADSRQDKLHVTQKPLELVARAIRMCSSPYSSVLDLFLGSGSTLIACEQTDRTCYGMELDPKYVDVIRKRYHKFVTGSDEGWENGTPQVTETTP